MLSLLPCCRLSQLLTFSRQLGPAQSGVQPRLYSIHAPDSVTTTSVSTSVHRSPAAGGGGDGGLPNVEIFTLMAVIREPFSPDCECGHLTSVGDIGAQGTHTLYRAANEPSRSFYNRGEGPH